MVTCDQSSHKILFEDNPFTSLPILKSNLLQLWRLRFLHQPRQQIREGSCTQTSTPSSRSLIRLSSTNGPLQPWCYSVLPPARNPSLSWAPEVLFYPQKPYHRTWPSSEPLFDSCCKSITHPTTRYVHVALFLFCQLAPYSPTLPVYLPHQTTQRPRPGSHCFPP
jgi:hypothetical protein